MGLLVIGIIFFFLFTSLWAFFLYVKNPPKIISDITPDRYQHAYEEVSFVTKDSLTLRGWFIPSQEETAKTIIALHGWPADKGDILPFVLFLNQKHNLLLFDFRALGESQGEYSTLGAREKEDLLAAVRYVKSRGIKEVGVWGFSVGGAVALMTAPEAPEIKAVVSESAYASLDRMAKEAFRVPLLRHPLGFMTGVWARALLGINIWDVSPLQAARRMDIPVLIIHSTDDEVIPFSHAELLKEALRNNEKAEFWFAENLAHGQLNSEHQERVQDFFDRNL